MKRVCAWCGKVIGYRKEGVKGGVTHGICRSCMSKMLKGKG
jgi:hypothetical protein